MTLVVAKDNNNSLLRATSVGMQNSALVLDEDANSISQELDYVSQNSEQNITPAAINIENSTDVIIGPVTHFNGPVTIYQNVKGSSINPGDNSSTKQCLNGRLVKSESTSSDTSHPAEKSSKNILSRTKHIKYIGVSLALLVIIVITASAIILSLKSDDAKPPPNRSPPKPSGKEDVNDKEKPGDPTGAIIEKRKWGGRPALNFTTPLKHPTSYVIIYHTATPQCKNFNDCAARVRQIQGYHVSSGKSPDIGYNFLVGGDGNAYVGRGWDIQNFNDLKDSILISFIGNYVFDYLTPDMINVTQKLINIGLSTSKLSQDYQLLAHNQTYNTISPGPHVYEVIKTWPHFNSTNFIPIL